MSEAKAKRIMDFGCGDALFLNEYRKANTKTELIGFEPFMDGIRGSTVNVVKTWDDIITDVQNNGKYDLVTSFEVFEHFNPERQEEALNRIQSVLASDGLIVVSVPIESGFPAVVKTLIRRIMMPHNKKFYSTRTAYKSLLGHPLPEFRKDPGYLSHVGFYLKDFEQRLISTNLKVVTKSFSPFKALGHNFNSQAFYKIKAS